MWADQESFQKYKITFESADNAREFRAAVFGFWEAIKNQEQTDPVLRLSVQKLRRYLAREESDPEFDFDGIKFGLSDNSFIPQQRYGWALDIYDIAVAVFCLSIETDKAEMLLRDLTHGIMDAHGDPSTTLKTNAGTNFGPYIQLTEELENVEITIDHVNLTLERVYRGQGVTDFDRERYIHPSHNIEDPTTFVSSIVANTEVEGLGSTLSYIYEKFVDLGEDETTANMRIIIHELIRMSSLNLDRPIVLIGASGIEEALLIKSGKNPDAPNLTLEDAIKSAYPDIISKEIGLACSVVRRVRNELGHTSWPSANISPSEIALTSSLVIIIFTELLDISIIETQELETLLDEFESHHNWEIEYANGNFTAKMPSDQTNNSEQS